MTSNLGSQLFQQAKTEEDFEKTRQAVLDLLKKTIRPEFLNRIDETVVFHPLTYGEIKQVVGLQIEGVKKMLRQNGITLQVEDSAVELLAEVGYDPDFGARPVKRAIQRLLLNDLSKVLLGTQIDRQRPIRVWADGNGKLSFSN
jgi:ATP-dependent Clp protease ATP-binding subunit ClpB